MRIIIITLIIDLPGDQESPEVDSNRLRKEREDSSKISAGVTVTMSDCYASKIVHKFKI